MFKLIVTLSLVALALGVPHRLNTGRIVNGEDARIEDFPYQVSLRLYGDHSCGASILDENTIVSAAHCVDGFRPKEFTVMVGSDQVHGNILHNVASIIQHPLYSDETSDYDISILKLATPIKFNSRASPIALQDSNDEVAVGTVAVVSGWGVLSEQEEDTPEQLQFVEVDVISHEDCRNSFYNKNKVTDRMLCAKRLGKDSCQGDSGGPLVANGKLIGVVSWGVGCAKPSYPGIYAKVSNLRQWVEQNK